MVEFVTVFLSVGALCLVICSLFTPKEGATFFVHPGLIEATGREFARYEVFQNVI